MFTVSVLEAKVQKILIVVYITILDINRRPVFYLKHGVSETGFRLSFQMEHAQLVQRQNNSIYWTQLKMGTESRLRNVVF
jgi:hypothetical protein